MMVAVVRVQRRYLHIILVECKSVALILHIRIQIAIWDIFKLVLHCICMYDFISVLVSLYL